MRTAFAQYTYVHLFQLLSISLITFSGARDAAFNDDKMHWRQQVGLLLLFFLQLDG